MRWKREDGFYHNKKGHESRDAEMVGKKACHYSDTRNPVRYELLSYPYNMVCLKKKEKRRNRER